jgi:cysteine-rich repeat protein
MRHWWVWVALSGCVSSQSVPCDGELVCPQGTSCASVTYPSGAKPYCASADEIAGCVGIADGEVCSGALPGTCHSGVCLENRCGNELVDQGEACDDGNTDDGEVGIGDGCSADCRSNQTCGNAIIDPIAHEECDSADPLQHDGCSSSCGNEVPTWDVLGNVQARIRFAIDFDADRERTVVFGGIAANGSTYGDTIEWNGERWHSARTPIAPTLRADPKMAYDRERHELVLFGGTGGIADTWTRDARGWHLRTPSTSPDVKPIAMTYDAKHHRVVLFAQHDLVTAVMETWAWDGATWSSIPTPSTLTFREEPGMSYDELRGVVVMFGGATLAGVGQGLDEVWELDDMQWSRKMFSGPAPEGRIGPAMTFDPVEKKTYVLGGNSSNGAYSDAWWWDGQAWQAAPAPTVVPPAFAFASTHMTTDSARNRIVVIGSNLDIYERIGTAWTGRWIDAGVPGPRRNPAAAVDPQFGEIVLHGGIDDSSNVVNDTWVWNGSWVKETTAMTSRFSAAMAYDPIRHEIVVYGGAPGPGQFSNQTWVRGHAGTTATWAQRSPAMNPGARRSHMMAWDGARNRVLLFGGANGSNVFDVLADTWSWDGTNWSKDVDGPTSTVASPTKRQEAAMAYDPIRKHVVLFGGASDTNVPLFDTWTWNGSTWTRHDLSVHPAARRTAQLAWDAARQRLVLFGGFSNAGVFEDVWEWDGSAWNMIPTTAAVGRRSHAVVSDPDGAGILVLAGSDPNNTLRTDVARLRWDRAEISDEACTQIDFDGDGLAGCADPDCWYVCTPLCAPGVTSCP